MLIVMLLILDRVTRRVSFFLLFAIGTSLVCDGIWLLFFSTKLGLAFWSQWIVSAKTRTVL